MAKVDVVLPVKNGQDYLAQSIDSIVNQSFRDWRLIILDHGSMDRTSGICHRYAQNDRRIEIHSLPDIQGLAALRNHGLGLCDAPYMACQDADDISRPDRLARQLSFLETSPRLAVVGSAYDMIDSGGRISGHVALPTEPDRLAAASIFSNPIAQPTVMANVNILRELGASYGFGFLIQADLGQIAVQHSAQDHLLFGQLAVLGKCANLPDRLVLYRRHGNSIGATKWEQQMRASLAISRYLVRYLSLEAGLPLIDPAPFCNFGGRLFDVPHAHGLDKRWQALEILIRQRLGNGRGVLRELAFRKSVASRSSFRLALNHILFRLRYRSELDEAVTMREWFAGPIFGRNRMFADVMY